MKLLTLQESYQAYVNKELTREQFRHVLARNQYNNKLYRNTNSLEDAVKILVNRGILAECACEDKAKAPIKDQTINEDEQLEDTTEVPAKNLDNINEAVTKTLKRLRK